MRLLDIKKQLDAGLNIYNMPLRVCFYARVSTDKTEQLHSLENQKQYFEEFIKNNENWAFAGGYIDEGLSGTTAYKRINFLRMIEDAKKGVFDLIITKEISRFSRSTLDSIKYTQELLTYGVGVLFQGDNINTLMPDSELRLTIMASIAQEESRRTSERLRFGYKRSIEKGRVLGQNNMYGYHKEDGKLTVVEEEAEVIRRIFHMYNEGRMGVRRIARELEKMGIVSPNTGKMFGADSIKYILLNPKYKGFYCSGKTISIDYRQNKRIRMESGDWNTYKDESIPALVSEELWDAVNALYRQRGEKSKQNGEAYLRRYVFSGKLFCGEHGTSYHRHIYKSKKRGEQEVWNCKLYRQKGKTEGCDSPTIYTAELQHILDKIYSQIYEGRTAVINGLMKIYENTLHEDVCGSGEKSIASKELEIEKIRQNKDQLLDLLMESLITKQEFKQRNDALNINIENIEIQISAIRQETEAHASRKAGFGNLKKLLEAEFDKGNAASQELNNVLLDKIIVRKIDGKKSHVKLEIHLKLGSPYVAELNEKNLISLEQIGISQAQVSRLEKNALKNMKKYIS